jgi:hypothetical protein
MLDAFCVECGEGRAILPLSSNGSCAYCGGSPRECECGENCLECDTPLEILGEWRAS